MQCCQSSRFSVKGINQMNEHYTLPELRRRILSDILERYGVENYVAFLQSMGAVRGNYTDDRQQWLGDVTLGDISRELGIEKRL